MKLLRIPHYINLGQPVRNLYHLLFTIDNLPKIRDLGVMIGRDEQVHQERRSTSEDMLTPGLVKQCHEALHSQIRLQF